MATFVSFARLKAKAISMLPRPGLGLTQGRARPSTIPRYEHLSLAADAELLDPGRTFSPNPALIESYTRFDDSDEANITDRTGEKLFYKGIPYSRYLGDLQFHPGRIGAHLTTAKLSPKLIQFANDILKLFVELPNGGLALYYPNTIRTARLQSNEYIYSGIAQGQLLAGYARLMQEAPNGGNWGAVAERIAISMQYPFEKGGVCLEGRAILEAPNFRSCPEIILNGWIDALIHLNDYIHLVGNKHLSDFYRQNMEALASLLPSFDDESAQLSKYSNLCPYVFRTQFRKSRRSPPRVIVEYLPRVAGYRPFRIDNLWSADGLKPCIYDNRIEKFQTSQMDLRLSVCSLYDLRFHVEADCSRISFDPGAFDQTSTVPMRTMQSRSLAPESRSNGFTTFAIHPSEHGLIAGCPTNFMKNGRENFYHVYHIVSLYVLALTTAVPEQRKSIIDMAARWQSYLGSHNGNRGVFAQPQTFLKKINRLRAAPGIAKFEDLRQRASVST